MRTFPKAIGFVGILTALLAQAVFTLAVQAEDDASVLVLKPAQGAAQAEELPAPEVSTTAGELPALPPPRANRRERRDARPVSHPGHGTGQSFMRPVQADGTVVETGPAPLNEPLPAPTAGEQVVYPVEDIEYDTDGDTRRLYATSDGVIDTVMITENPADGCLYEIPLCLPACCVGEPTVESKRGLFGRGVVEYCWPCGLEVEVKFRLRGDVKVDYDG